MTTEATTLATTPTHAPAPAETKPGDVTAPDTKPPTVVSPETWRVLAGLTGVALIGAILAARYLTHSWEFLSDARLQHWLSRYRMATLLLSGILALVAAPIFRPRPLRDVLFMAAATLPPIGLLVGMVTRANRWGWILALLPSALIVHHVVFVYLYRRAFTKPDAERRPPPPRFDEGLGFLEEVIQVAQGQNERYFSSSTLAIRYGVPAILIGVATLAAFYCLFSADAEIGTHNVSSILRATRLGVAGAYTYTMLYLGGRSLRHDVTSGGAMWCAVVLVIGPTLAAAIQVFIKNPGDSTSFAPTALYFLAGLAPRQVADWLDRSLRRIWFPASTPPPTRTVPLTQLRGMTSAFEERLAEEDITDVHGMAMADPLKLFRNTNFDKRLLLSWIDEALLMDALPAAWPELELAGISGATDLARFGKNLAPMMAKQMVEGGSAPNPDSSGLIALDQIAGDTKVKPAALGRVSVRLFQDRQVLLIWALKQYVNSDDLGASGEGGRTGTEGA